MTEAIGGRLQKLREEMGLRQEDVASAARDLGLPWSRVAVARLEAGLRELEAGEFVMLPEVLMVASMRARGQNDVSGIERVIELTDVLPLTGTVAVTPQCRVDASHLRLMLEGRYRDVRLADLDVPLMRELRKQQTLGVAAIGRRLAETAELEAILNAIWAKAPAAMKAKAIHAAAGEAEQKTARKLRTHPAAVALAALRRWGQSLTAERDKRVSERSSAASPRRVQALRGHVTRGLVAELTPLLNNARGRRLHS